MIIGQGITIGGRNGIKEVPVIEDNVFISAGARILGNVNIGHDSIIGTNAVVLRDIPPYSVVAGVPEKLSQKLPRKPSMKNINSTVDQKNIAMKITMIWRIV